MVNEPLRTPGKNEPSKSRLRLWLRLLRSSRFVENEIRNRLRTEYGVTLPRFDVMAALYREPDGMLMSELSRYLMVSNGNVTGIVDRLVDDGMVIRAHRQGDRRAWLVRLTPKGTKQFSEMAARHESWIDEILAAYSASEAEGLSRALGHIEKEQC